MSSHAVSEVLRETLALFDEFGTPQTTTEVADRLDLGRRSTYERLRRLVEHDRLETKKVGANGRVWWRPRGRTDGRSSTARDWPAAETSLLKDVLDSADIGAFLLDENFEVVWINDTTERYFGIDREAVVGRDKRRLVAERISPRIDERERFKETVLATYDDNTYTEQFECRVTAGEKREARWLRHRSTPVESGPYAGGRVELYFDVTERRRARSDLIESERKFRAVFEEAFDAMLIADDDATYVDVNPAAADLFDLPAADLLGRSIDEFAPEDYDFERAWHEFQESDQDRGLFPFVRSDGERRTVEFAATPNVLPGRHLSIIRDVTDREERERELRATTEHLEAVIEASPNGIVVLDENGIVEGWNPGAERIFGWTEAEVLGEVIPVVPEAKRSAFEERLEAVNEGETFHGLEVQRRTKAGDSVDVSISTAPIHDADRGSAGTVAVIHDITERKERERRYDAIFNQTYQFTGLLEPDGTLVEANESALSFGGVDRAAVVGQKLWNAYWFEHGKASDRVREAVERARDGEFVRREVEARGTDRIAVIDFSVRPVTDDRGEVTHLVPEGRDITDRVEAERELERNREQLAALNDVNNIVHDITAAVINQSTREEIEQTVCKALADTDSCELAWIGDVDTDSQTVHVRTMVGDGCNLDESAFSGNSEDEDGGGPTKAAFRTQSMQVANGIDADSERELWCSQADAIDVRSAAAIPLVHDGTAYGVLNVCAGRPSAFEGEKSTVIGQLGALVGHAIAATERKRALISDEIVELEFRIPNILGSMEIDATAEGRITIDDVVATSDEAQLVYGTATPAARETLDALIDQHPRWDSLTVLAEEGTVTRFEARVSELPLRSEVASQGGSIDEVLFEGGDLRLRVHLAPSVDTRSVTETVRSAYPTAQLLAKRQFPRSRQPATHVRQMLVEKLTDRQQAVLETAYHRGYFEWPRDASGEDLAESLDIAPPTFSQHLRSAERKVFESVFSSPTPT